MTIQFWKSLARLYRKHLGPSHLLALRVVVFLGSLMRLLVLPAWLSMGGRRASERFGTSGQVLKWALGVLGTDTEAGAADHEAWEVPARSTPYSRDTRSAGAAAP